MNHGIFLLFFLPVTHTHTSPGSSGSWVSSDSCHLLLSVLFFCLSNSFRNTFSFILRFRYEKKEHAERVICVYPCEQFCHNCRMLCECILCHMSNVQSSFFLFQSAPLVLHSSSRSFDFSLHHFSSSLSPNLFVVLSPPPSCPLFLFLSL